LRRRSRQQRLGHGRKAPRELAIVRQLRIADERADAHGAAGEVLDFVEAGKMGDVDQSIGTADAALHQVEQVSAARQIDGARLSGGRDRLGDRLRPHIRELFHATSLRLCAASLRCASSTASVMP
jgi:hypothetical protein